MDRRQELKKKLREKIHAKRNNTDSATALAKNVKNDPQTALMRMGIDDPQILANANSILKNPKQLLSQLSDMISDMPNGNVENEIEEEEEAPPEML